MEYILFYFLFQIMVNKKHGKQNRKKCGIYKRHFLFTQSLSVWNNKWCWICLLHKTRLQISCEGLWPFFDACVIVFHVIVFYNFFVSSWIFLMCPISESKYFALLQTSYCSIGHERLSYSDKHLKRQNVLQVY